MPLKHILVHLTCLLALSWAGQAPAEPQGTDAHEHGLSSSEHKRMRSDLERFSREQPRRGDFEKRREIFRERARQRFHDADTNGDGGLSREELARLNPGAAKNFDQLDHNADGELSEQEVAQAIRKHVRQRYKRQP